jgi:deoxyribodipyrimidine photo-lyase
VAGLQTPGKTYLATAENIARYTNGRFAPTGLAEEAVALTESPVPPAREPAALALPVPGEPSMLLVTHEDLNPESVLPPEVPIAAALVVADHDLLWGETARAFVDAAAADSAARVAAHFSCPVEVAARLDAATLAGAARAAGVRQVVTPYAPVGPVAEALAAITPILMREGIGLVPIRRSWDERFWPGAKKGFFAFDKRIPALLSEEGLL